MTKRLLRFVVVIVFISALALAHKPLLLVEENDAGGILIEAGFSTGESGAGFKIIIQEKATGRVLEAVTMPEASVLELPMPAVPYTVTFDAGEGHIVAKEGPFTAAEPAPSGAQAVVVLTPEADREEPPDLLVISALTPVYWLASAICQGAAIQVVNLHESEAVALPDQASWLRAHPAAPG